MSKNISKLHAGDGDDMAELEQEYEKTLEQDGAAAKALRERTLQDQATGRAILQQRAVWERLLGVR